MSNDEAWMMMLLLLCFAQEHGKELSFIDILEQEKADTEFVKNCPSVEWEQDMHANIPFCKLDGEMCNMQCRNRKKCSSYNAEKSDIIFDGGIFNDKRRENGKS